MLKNLLLNARKFTQKLLESPDFLEIKAAEFNLSGVTQKSIEKYAEISFARIFQAKKQIYMPLSPDDEDFTLGVFFLPKGMSIPLHDHPKMHVLSKVLFGRIEVLSLDFFSEKVQFSFPKKLYNYEPIDGFRDEVIHAKLSKRSVLKPNEGSVLSPKAGNLHRLVALEDSAIVDLLAPKYDLETRFCNFYEILKEKDGDFELRYVFPPPEEHEFLRLEIRKNDLQKE